MGKGKLWEHILYKILLLDYIKDDFALEFQNATIKITMGLLLFIVGPFVFEKNPSMFQNITYFDARIWGVILIALGSSHIYALLHKKKLMRKNILFVAGCLWLTLGASLVLSNPISFMPWMYIVFAFTSFRCYLCIQHFNRFQLHTTLG